MGKAREYWLFLDSAVEFKHFGPQRVESLGDRQIHLIETTALDELQKYLNYKFDCLKEEHKELQAKYDEFADIELEKNREFKSVITKLKEHAESMADALESTYPNSGISIKRSCRLVTKSFETYRKDFPKGGGE